MARKKTDEAAAEETTGEVTEEAAAEETPATDETAAVAAEAPAEAQPEAVAAALEATEEAPAAEASAAEAAAPEAAADEAPAAEAEPAKPARTRKTTKAADEPAKPAARPPAKPAKTTEAAPVSAGGRGRRKTRIGVVYSSKMLQTVVVAIESKVRHPLYGKTIRRTTKFKAHDQNSECGPGDTVEIMETRPISREKRWRVVRIVEKAK